ncbi:hypothetical protein C818_01427 [Lachnospiraceae bacterium MD308]|nr:hypothetical protein C818_01427 [Lachnospiraceae bacterium MD308]
MSSGAVLFFLLLVIAVLICIVLCQRFAFHRGTQESLRSISGKLKEINETGSDEKILIFTDNPELKELAAQINAVLEKHQKVKADFRRSETASKKMLSNISHDLKTPMTVILGYLEIMRLNGSDTDNMLSKAELKARNMLELMNEFFTLAKLESGDMDIGLSNVDAAEICRESILDFYEILTGQGFQVDVLLPEEPVYALGDSDSIKRILSNLISNAIRYGYEGKYLGIALRAEEDSVFIDVTDKGKGIDKLFAESVFDRLFTMEDSRSRSVQGNGLGLTIAKSLAGQLGGTLTLESVPYENTTFTLRLRKNFVRFEQEF